MLNTRFPLTPALSLKERENRSQNLPFVKARGRFELRNIVLPLPKGEGWGEGKGNVRKQQRDSSRTSAAPRLLFILGLALAIASLVGCASPGDSNPQIYDTKADGEKQLAEALHQAKTEHKRVLLDLGA